MSECIIVDVSDAHNWSVSMHLARENIGIFQVIPLAERPTLIQPNRLAAEKEAARLAGKTHGSRFAVFECVGIVHSRLLGDEENIKGVGPCHALLPEWELSTEL